MIKYLREWRRLVAAPLVVTMAALSFPLGPAQAAMVGTDRIVEQDAGLAREKVADFIARDDVRDQMQVLGVAPDEAAARVASLSDDEVRAIADRIDTLPAGQGAVGAVVGAAVLIFVILLITDLMGLTDVFGFTNKGALRAK